MRKIPEMEQMVCSADGQQGAAVQCFTSKRADAEKQPHSEHKRGATVLYDSQHKVFHFVTS